MELTTVVEEKKYAPEIVIPRQRYEFLGKALVYNAVQTRITDLAQQYDTYFVVWYASKKIEVFYGFGGTSRIITDRKIVPIHNAYAIPAIAQGAAEAAVSELFGSL